MPVPERGWGSGPVRVCQACHQQGGPAEADHQGETLCRLITAANEGQLTLLVTVATLGKLQPHCALQYVRVACLHTVLAFVPFATAHLRSYSC